jgi:hypothetical protein
MLKGVLYEVVLYINLINLNGNEELSITYFYLMLI